MFFTLLTLGTQTETYRPKRCQTLTGDEKSPSSPVEMDQDMYKMIKNFD